MKKMWFLFVFLFIISYDLVSMHESSSAVELNEIFSISPISVAGSYFDQFCPVSPKSKKDCPISPIDKYCPISPLSPSSPDRDDAIVYPAGIVKKPSLLAIALSGKPTSTPEFIKRKMYESKS